MNFLTGFIVTAADTVKNLTTEAPKEGDNWIIEHVSDHPFLKLPEIHIGSFTLDLSITTNILMMITVAMTQVYGIKNNGFFGYFKGLVPPGVPIYVLPIMIVIEFLALLTKPFALCIRLFANMSAGHIVILAFISLIFTLGYAIIPV